MAGKTQISTLSGIGSGTGNAIPLNEYKDRSNEVSKGDFIPMNQLTEGELRLLLLADQAKLLHEFTGNPVFQQGRDMALNAIHAGVHSAPGIGSFGNVPREIAEIAKTIRWAKNRHTPGGIAAMALRGIGNADKLIPMDATNCAKKAHKLYLPFHPKKSAAFKHACEAQHFVTNLFNEKLPTGSHYTTYNWLDKGGKYSALATTKMLLQKAGVEEIGRVARHNDFPTYDFGQKGITQSNVTLWMGNSVMRQNATYQGINAPYTPAQWNLILAKLDPNDPASVAKQKWRNGVKGIGVAGVDDAVILAVIGLASVIIKALADNSKQKKADAFAAVAGFGSDALAPGSQDWDGDGIIDPPIDKNESGGLSTNTLLIGGAAAAGLFLFTQK